MSSLQRDHIRSPKWTLLALVVGLLVLVPVRAEGSLPRVIASDVASNNAGRLVTFDLVAPAQAVVLAALTGPTYLVGVETLDGGDHTQLVGLASDHQLWQIEVATGHQTAIGLASIPFPRNWAGLARDPTTGELFAAANCFFPCQESYLYRVAADYQSVSLVGTLTGVTTVIDIAFDNDGRLFALNIAPVDELVRIDPETGIGTVIGPIGFNANFGQGMDFDRRTNSLYLFGYNLDSSRAELWRVDSASGSSEFLGPIGDSATFSVEGVIEELPPTVEVPTLGTVASFFFVLSLLSVGIYRLSRKEILPPHLSG